VVVNLLQFALQFLLFLGFYLYSAAGGASLRPTLAVIWLPALVLQMALLGFGMGLTVAAVTTKYRDLIFVMGFGMQLWMFATPVVYPASLVDGAYRGVYMLNPLVSVVEMFRLAFLGQGTVEPVYVLISWGITLAVLTAGVLLFNRAEKTVMDAV
jgi:lipopolysaccharide transport system permease protein